MDCADGVLLWDNGCLENSLAEIGVSEPESTGPGIGPLSIGGFLCL